MPSSSFQRKLFSLLLVLPLCLTAQQGIQFEHLLTWKEIQAKAKAENKYIFLDAFTTWCGPCKYMAANIFPMEKVGKFFNEKFINVKVQLDTTATDNQEVKDWYADGHDIMMKYNIRAFPTYLFFDQDGQLVHRIIGGSEADQFISRASNVLDPEKQFYVMLNQYNSGKKDPAFLKKAAFAALDAGDRENMGKISREYLATQKDLLTKENLDFIHQFTNSSKDPGFAIMMQNEMKFDEVNSKGSAKRKILEIITREDLYPVIYKNDGAPDWGSITQAINEKYPKYSKELISGTKAMYYERMEDWPNFQVAILAFMKDYSASLSPWEINNIAWTVFLNCKDMTCVKEALEWSKSTFKDKEDPMFIDTYANILYKLGRKDEAIQWQEKAVLLANNDNQYVETLDKMKKGEKTWKE